MTNYIITKKVNLTPNLLGKNYMKHLYERVCETMLDRCDENHGYILSVEDDIKVLDNEIAPNSSSAVFNISVSVKALKPEIGCEYKGNVMMVFDQGVLVSIGGKIKVLVPKTDLPGYELDKNKMSFIRKKKSISKGGEIYVVIKEIKYEHKNFSCIGMLKK